MVKNKGVSKKPTSVFESNYKMTQPNLVNVKNTGGASTPIQEENLKMLR